MHAAPGALKPMNCFYTWWFSCLLLKITTVWSCLTGLWYFQTMALVYVPNQAFFICFYKWTFFLLGRTVVVNFLTFYCFYCCVFTLTKHVQELWGFIGVSLSLLLGLSNVDCPSGTHECEFAVTQFPLNKQWLPIMNLLMDICCICDEGDIF